MSDLIDRSGAAVQRASDAVIRAESQLQHWDPERRRARPRLDHDHREIARENAEMSMRVEQVKGEGRRLALWLASAADDIARTLDHVAETREARAKQVDLPESDHRRESARRARQKAAAERRESRRLREQWDLPPR